MVDESILSKLKKIRELATKSTELGEVENATKFYQELLLKHNITDEEINKHTIQTIEEYATVLYYNHMRGKNVNKWKLDLAWAVARPNLCTIVYSHDYKIITWLGKKSNIAAAQFLYETIVEDLERIADEKWSTIEALRKLERETGVEIFKPDSELRGTHGKAWKNAFYWGAVESIKWRLEENLRKLQEDSRLNALVINTEAELKDFKRKEFPKLSKGHLGAPETYSHAGYTSGQLTGKGEVQFKRGIGAGGSHAPKLIGGS